MKSLFIYSKPLFGFSGQAAATELIINGFRSQSKQIEVISTPQLDRSKQASLLKIYVGYLYSLIKCWLSAFGYRFCKLEAIHLTLGQTPVAIVRDGVSLMLCSFFRSKSDCIRGAALNGSVFTAWSSSCIEARLFRLVIGRCHFVTCLGAQHRDALISLGIPKTKVQVVPNVCEYDGVDHKFVDAKHAEVDRPVRLLYLSSLIDTKGFPEYLEALHSLSFENKFKLHATLCGPITMSQYSDRFTSAAEARKWIVQIIKSINSSASVHVDWVEGAVGAQKRKLFEKAHIFVLPTRYKVEAQPLAVIEAMAFGCAIVTSDVGELPSTVDSNSAIILSDPDSEKVRFGLDSLCADPTFRRRLAHGALDRFLQDFNRKAYLQRWTELLFN
tara:strand:- start:5972 stop:7129 length:1158 start_codon:yes stop_codon:yes gene_type:complete